MTKDAGPGKPPFRGGTVWPLDPPALVGAGGCEAVLPLVRDRTGRLGVPAQAGSDPDYRADRMIRPGGLARRGDDDGA